MRSTRPYTRWFLVAVVSVFWVVSVGADTIHVPSDYGLQEAVDHAAPGDTVLIAPGTYNEGSTVSLSSGITLMSEGASPSSVRLAGGNSRRVLQADSVTGVTIVGLTIENGGGVDEGAGLRCVDSELVLEGVVLRQNFCDSAGAGLHCTGSTVDLLDCAFEDNEVGDIYFTNSGPGYSGRGAGAYFGDGCTVTAERVTFVSNRTWSAGGGLYLRGATTSGEFTDCEFTDNSTFAPWGPISSQFGAAICVNDAQLTLTQVAFLRNVAATAGGAIYSWSNASITVEDCTFAECEGGSAGGALYLGLGNGSLSVRESLFTENVAGLFGGGAAWVRCVDSPCEFSYCIFAHNESSGEGGAVKNWYGPADVTNCTFFGNRAPSGSHLVYRWGASGTISNSILGFGLEGLPLTCPEGGLPEVSRCCVFGNASGDSLCGVLGDNAYGDPLFCDAAGGDFSLCSNSTCLPPSNQWGELVGALGEGCGPCSSVVEEMSWGAIKAMFR
jgi:predicted outer membrane repeat protein